MNRLFVGFTASLVSFAALAAPPGGGVPGGGGNQPGGNQPGGGGSAVFTFDTFLASTTTNATRCLIREGVWTGWATGIGAASLASSVTRLAPGVCSGCATLASVDLSACTTLTEIPDSAFAGCTALRTVKLPPSCTTIGANAFAGCTALTTVEASGVASVGSDAFHGCTSLAAVPSSAADIGAYAFAGSGVASVDLGGVSALGEGAFAGCESLTDVAAATQTALPAAVFAGCTTLDAGDWSGIGEFGQAALAGIPATTLTVSPSATLGAYAFAADAATVATTLDQAALPAYDSSAFLGRELSYAPAAGSVAKVEAKDLVDWLSDETASAGVEHPADYNTETLKAWLADADNAYAYAYADDLAANPAFAALTVSGMRFLYMTPSDVALSVTPVPVACYTLSPDASDWLEENLVWSDDDGAYRAADETQTMCFARLKFLVNW